MMRKGLDFESMPRMSFDDNGCTWNYILQREIYGSFAPQSGWIGSLKKGVDMKIRGQRRKAMLNSVACAMLNFALPKSNIAKALKRHQTAKCKEDTEKIEKIEKDQQQAAKLDRLEKRLRYGQICEVIQGNRVFQ